MLTVSLGMVKKGGAPFRVVNGHVSVETWPVSISIISFPFRVDCIAMAQYDDLPIKRIVVVGLLSIAVTFITVLGVQVLYFGMQGYVDQRKFAESTYRESLEVLDVQTRRISRYDIDEESGRITIPVDKAMKAMVAEASKKKNNDNESNKTDEI
jgi:hypothetical protein